MKIRTQLHLLGEIEKDRIWRIREIASLLSQCSRSDISADTVSSLRRSFVPIAYAHWEGFVKNISHYYLEYISRQNLCLEELNYPFMSLYLRKEHSAELQRGKHFSLKEICDAIINKPFQRVQIQYKDVISTNSNLNSKTLRDICDTLGLSFKKFETKALFLDATLLEKRNRIAHGDWQEIDKTDLENIKSQVIELIDTFRTEVEDAASLKAFKRNTGSRNPLGTGSESSTG